MQHRIFTPSGGAVRVMSIIAMSLALLNSGCSDTFLENSAAIADGSSIDEKRNRGGNKAENAPGRAPSVATSQLNPETTSSVSSSSTAPTFTNTPSGSNVPTLPTTNPGANAAKEPIGSSSGMVPSITALTPGTVGTVPKEVIPVVVVDAPGSTPGSIVLEDWSSGSGKVVGSALIDNSLPDLDWEDADLAREMGKVTVRGVSQSIRWGEFEFGALALWSSAAKEGGGGVHQVLVGAKPFGRWSTYPYQDTFKPATDLTIPPAFKVKLLSKTGLVLNTYQMRDGKAINDASLSQTRAPGTGALRPFFNIGMLLPWSSARTKASDKLNSHFPGFKPMPESKGKISYATNGAIPLLGFGAQGRTQINGLNHWHAMPRWPLGLEVTESPTLDPFGYAVPNIWTGDGPWARSAWATGWDYEPGSISGHDWYSGPGGMRFDRAVIPTPMAYLASDPNYRRPKDGTPIRDLVDAWGLAYFNHSGHYLTDVTQFKSIMNTPAERDTNSQMGSYYGGKTQMAPPAVSIDMRAINSSDSNLEGNNGGTDPAYYYDKNGNRFWGGWVPDGEHAYQLPYWHTILLNSPMHLISSRAAFNQSFLSRLSTRDITMRPVGRWDAGPSYASINSRIQAYRWLHYTLMWKMATKNPLGVSREAIEALLLKDLALYHDKFVLPIRSETTNPYHVAFKKLGMGVFATQTAEGWKLQVEGTAASYYHAGLLLAMKNLGLWEKLRLDPKAKATLDFIVESLNKFSIDFILDADGRAEDPSGVIHVAGPFARFEDIKASDVPTWAEWGKRYPAKGQENWIRDVNGKFTEKYAAQHVRAQWAIMVRDWFPELNSPRAAEAAAKYERHYAEWDAMVNTKATPLDKMLSDMQTINLPYWQFKAPK
jgi:hypothetical protein